MKWLQPKCLLWRHSSVDFQVDVAGKAQATNCLRNSHSLALDIDETIGAAIALLLFWCGPSAILWRVRTVVVDAVQRCTSWPRPPITEKRLKRITPLSAHVDTTATVVGEVLMARPLASLLGRLPRVIFDCLLSWMRGAVAPLRVSVQTSTTSGVSGSQMHSEDHHNRSALAPRAPFRAALVVLVAESFQDDQSAERAASHVNQWRHVPRIA